ncbi:hypothetical protein [Streptomyces sp. NRRL S-495]|uniref:hypothetical protein n=1 Tax=Streptomyces sp. NRRL S-495 TaxID=1609133 RepID=UPI0005F89D2C|nr:hypothetical protein [Streptomyces sp. NRRL S-495]KJY32159.1 hypothetical protein VR45_23370 [Streptomyces sp. NRRL S-495]
MSTAKKTGTASDKAAALRSGRTNRSRTLTGGPSAAAPQGSAPTGTAATAETDRTTAAPAAPGRRADGDGRRGHFRKLSVEMTPEEHRDLKQWLLNAFDSDTKATPVIKALLAEAYHDTAFTDRVRRRLQREAGLRP